MSNEKDYKDVDIASDNIDDRRPGSITEDGQEPTLEEQQQLRHVSDTIPLAAWLVAVVELAERFTYYGLTGPFREFSLP